MAIGDEEFVMKTKANLGAMAIGRGALENNEGYELVTMNGLINLDFPDIKKESVTIHKRGEDNGKRAGNSWRNG